VLGELGGTPSAMMLIGDKLRVVPMTGHIPFEGAAQSQSRKYSKDL
jgi:4-hydroxy-L-threonine phosphate dehydrogenase PdxA